MSLNEYRAVVAKVDAFAAAVSERRRADLTCHEGCDACCHVSLEIAPVEAASVRAHLASLAPAVRERIAARGREAMAAEGGEPRCAMLDGQGRCEIYEARPLVCRTQGLPLRYPPGFVPAEAIGATSEAGDVTWCPLNFQERAPAGGDVLDAGLVDQLLAVVNQRYAAGEPAAALERVGMARLAAEAAP